MLKALSPLGSSFGASTPVTGASQAGFEVSERSDFGCVLCTAAVDLDDVQSLLLQQLQINLPSQSGAVAQDGELSSIWLSPRSWLILCPLDEETKLVASINAIFPDRHLLASAFSDYLCWLSLSGKLVEDALHRGGFISLASGGLPEGHAKRTLIAGIPTIVNRNSAHNWTLGIERSHASYIADWLRTLSI